VHSIIQDESWEKKKEENAFALDSIVDQLRHYSKPLQSADINITVKKLYVIYICQLIEPIQKIRDGQD
jgi:hypothetical protein